MMTFQNTASNNQWTRIGGCRLIVGLLAASAMVAPSIARAQSGAVAETASVPEVVVTAQRRTQSIVDVGIEVTAVSAERLQERRVQNVADLSQLTSAVDVRPARPGGQPIITIRGVGMNDFTASSNPSTAVYIDNVYYPNIGTLSGLMFDTASAEILKGPQSTLYGRNSTAGSVNITSTRPTDYLSGYATAGYANYGTFNGAGAISGPLSPTLLGRLAIQTEQRSQGYMKNEFPGGATIGDSHKTGVRGQLEWVPDDRWDLLGVVSYANENDQPGAFTPYGIHVPGGAAGKPATASCPVFLSGHIDFANTCASAFGYQRPYTDPYTISENDPWTVSSDTFAGSLNATYKADGFNIRSTTSYLRWRELYVKSDGLPTRETTQALHQRTWQVSEDLQILSTNKGPLTWITGLYLAKADTNNPTYSDQRQQSGLYTNSITHNEITVSTAQIYAQFDYNLTPKLQATAGARYIYEENSKVGGTLQNTNYTGEPDNGVVTPAYVQKAFLDRTIHQNALTWKLGLNYKFTPDSLLYASVTHGFKSGGFVSTLATSVAQLLPYKGEDIYAYEVGAKQYLFERRVQLSASAFYYRYKDLQTNQNISFGTIFINTFNNIPKAHLSGLDLEAKFRLVTGLEISLDAGFLDTELGAFTSAGGVVVPAGNRFANAPKFTGGAEVRYEFPLTQDYDLVVGSSAHHQGMAFSDTVNTPAYSDHSAYTLVDAHIDLIAPKAGLTLSVWGKNLTDQLYSNATFANSSVLFATWNMPRTYGVSVTKKF